MIAANDFVMFRVIVATSLSTAVARLLLNASNHTADCRTTTTSMARLLGSVGAWLKNEISLDTIFHLLHYFSTLNVSDGQYSVCNMVLNNCFLCNIHL